MINTRLSIFKSLKKLLKELTRHANNNTKGFKDVLYAVILNDMREWAQYIPNDDVKILDKILEQYILEYGDLQIERFVDQPDLYKNVNTPQDNTTWRRIWDDSKTINIDLSDKNH